MNKYVVAVTGASGSVIGIMLIRELLKTSEVHLIISEEALSILRTETGYHWKAGDLSAARKFFDSEHIYLYNNSDFYCPVASGSFLANGMFVVPCSMKTLSGIANGYGQSLIERAADVTIKEGRRLLISPREMPFSAIHLENMLKLARLGVIIAPPVPAFYHRPAGIDDMVSFFCGKMLDAFGIDNSLFNRWKGLTVV